MNIILSILLTISSVDAAPLLITRTSGTVEVDNNGTKSAAPKTTFALLDGQTLHIAEGALATIVSSGKAEQIVGPKSLTTKDAIGSADVASHKSSLETVLNRQNSAANVGATRSKNGFQVTLPIPDSRTLDLERIQWVCTKCDFEQIEIWKLEGFQQVWTSPVSLSDRAITYTGPTLAPGEYAVKINDIYSGFEVLGTEDRATIEEALQESERLAKDLSTIDKLSVEAAVLWNFGLWGGTIKLLDDVLESDPQNQAVKDLKAAYVQSMWQGHEK